jgi:hypothetical protein
MIPLRRDGPAMTRTDHRRPGPRDRVAAVPLFCLALLTAVSAAAADGVGPGAAAPYIDCRCRANGRSYALGERACVYTPGGPRIAECRMVQNVTSWAVQGDGCVVSGLGRLGPRG